VSGRCVGECRAGELKPVCAQASSGAPAGRPYRGSRLGDRLLRCPTIAPGHDSDCRPAGRPTGSSTISPPSRRRRRFIGSARRSTAPSNEEAHQYWWASLDHRSERVRRAGKSRSPLVGHLGYLVASDVVLGHGVGASGSRFRDAVPGVDLARCPGPRLVESRPGCVSGLSRLVGCNNRG
jgi:hypothetical protein